MKLHSILLGGKKFLTKSCVSPQVFHGGMRLTGGGRKAATVRGVKPSRQCSKPGSLNSGGALESEDMVKVDKCSQASSCAVEPYEAVQGSGQNGTQSGPGGLTSPGVNPQDCRCSRADLNPSRIECRTWKRCSSGATLFVVALTARRGSGGSIEMTEEANAEV